MCVLGSESWTWQQLSEQGKSVSRLKWEVAGSRFTTGQCIWMCSSGKETVWWGMEPKGSLVIKASSAHRRAWESTFKDNTYGKVWDELVWYKRKMRSHTYLNSGKETRTTKSCEGQCQNNTTKWKDVVVFYCILKIQNVIRYSGEQKLNSVEGNHIFLPFYKAL